MILCDYIYLIFFFEFEKYFKNVSGKGNKHWLKMSKLLFAIYIKKGTKDIKYHAACNVYVLVNQVN